MKRAMLIGATGLVGSHLLRRLLENPNFLEVAVFSRNDPQITHPKLTVYRTDFEHPGTRADHIHGEILFSAFGTTIAKAKTNENFYKIDVEYPLQFARIAKQNGCEQFHFVSAVSADPESAIPYIRAKGKMEEQAIEIGFSTIGIYKPSMLLGNRTEFRLSERLLIHGAPLFSRMIPGRFRKYRAIQADTVAAAMIRNSLKKTEGVHRYFYDEMTTL